MSDRTTTCPKCGSSQAWHEGTITHFRCHSEQGAEFRQSARCKLNASEQQIARLAAENERLGVERSADLTTAAKTISELIAERDAFRAGMTSLTAENERLKEANSALANTKARLKIERDAAVAALKRYGITPDSDHLHENLPEASE